MITHFHFCAGVFCETSDIFVDHICGRKGGRVQMPGHHFYHLYGTVVSFFCAAIRRNEVN